MRLNIEKPCNIEIFFNRNIFRADGLKKNRSQNQKVDGKLTNCGKKKLQAFYREYWN